MFYLVQYYFNKCFEILLNIKKDLNNNILMPNIDITNEASNYI
jgi:hypothetical protein